MGLSMIETLDDFQTALPAPVQMRVGIHTGMVLTGLGMIACSPLTNFQEYWGERNTNLTSGQSL